MIRSFDKEKSKMPIMRVHKLTIPHTQNIPYNYYPPVLVADVSEW